MHVNRFYHSPTALTPKGENSQIARDILVDVVGCSGLDLRGIKEISKGTTPDVRSISLVSQYILFLLSTTGEQLTTLILPHLPRFSQQGMRQGRCYRNATRSLPNTHFCEKWYARYCICIHRNRQTAFVYQGRRPR